MAGRTGGETDLVRSNIAKQFPIGTQDNTPPYRKAPFPVTQFPNVIKGAGVSQRSDAPFKGSIVTLDLGGGQLVTGEILDYFIINGDEQVQVRVGNNIYLRPSYNIK